MAEDWLADVRRYAADADENVVRKIVNYLGIALRNRDSSLVSFSDPQEVGRVRENFLRKKLGLTEPDSELNTGLDWVKGLMSADRTKNRVTVYYLLAHYFGKLDLFGGAAGTSAASIGSAAASGAAAPPASVIPLRSEAGPDSTPSKNEEIPVYPSPSTARTSSGSTLGQSASASKPTYAADMENDDRGGSGWPKWLTWLLVALAVIALFFLLRSCMAEKPSTTTNVASTAPATTGAGVNTNAATSAISGGATTAVPTGSGVVSGEQDSKPMLTVYFDTGKSAVSKDMASAVETLKAYLDSHPGSKLAVSGYNDPSGNAAINAALSKKRAEGVAAALKSAGIPEASVELVKPSDTTTTTVTPEQARRVEITVQP